jgi:hypothetical protein
MLKNRLFVKTFIGLSALAGACSLAQADNVVFSTIGTFGTTGTNSITGGGITLTFDQLPATNSVNTAPFGTTFTSLGDFDINVVAPTSFAISDTFTLTVQQTIPGPGGSAAFGIGTVSGTVTANSSGATVTFTSPLSIVIPGTTADITYQLMGTPTTGLGGAEEEYFIVPVTTNNGVTSVQANVISVDHAPTVPTPASMLSGTALLGGLFVAKMRNRRKSA